MAGFADFMSNWGFGGNNSAGSDLIGAGGAGSTPIAGVGSTSLFDGATFGPKMGGMTGSGPQGGGGNIMDFLFGNKGEGTNGALVPTAQAITGLAGTYLGMKQYGLAKDAFKESKRQFQLNYDAQKKDYNSSISDRQQTRRASAGSGADAHATKADYMKKWGI